MPEGDTIHRTADVLRRALVGGRIAQAYAQPRPGLVGPPDLGRLVGSRVESVEARGKNLLVAFDAGLTLRTHMRMRGSWHRYRPDEPWRRPRHLASVVLATEDTVAVCFDAPVVELLTRAELSRHPPLTGLGPDLLAPAFDADEALDRLGRRGMLELGEALIDQGAVAGIGNVYKSELCFIERISPWQRVEVVDREALRRLLDTARRLLAHAARRGRRVTTDRRDRGAALWVYGRAGRPCRRCGSIILVRRQGALARATYWCPRCQLATEGS